MTRFASQSLAVAAAVLITVLGLQQLATVPPMPASHAATLLA